MTDPGFASTMTATVTALVTCSNDPCTIPGCPVHDLERTE